LEELEFVMVGLTDEDVCALAEAMRGGNLSQNLKELSFIGNSGVTNRGALRLAEALHEGDAPLLRNLHLHDTKTRGAGARALVVAVLNGCPALTELFLPGEIKEPKRSELASIVRSVERKKELWIKYH
jgi:hypothetical protein